MNGEGRESEVGVAGGLGADLLCEAERERSLAADRLPQIHHGSRSLKRAEKEGKVKREEGV